MMQAFLIGAAIGFCNGVLLWISERYRPPGY